MPDQEVAEHLRALRRHGFDYEALTEVVKNLLKDGRLTPTTINVDQSSDHKRYMALCIDCNAYSFKQGLFNEKIEEPIKHAKDCLVKRCIDFLAVEPSVSLKPTAIFRKEGE